jgi:arylsulfatase A-like enzyme
VLLIAAVGVGLKILWMQPHTRWSLEDGTHDAAPAAVAISRDVRHVVLISIDTLRADHLGCYGYSSDTSPNIDALAGEGTLFNHAISPVPTTLPAHATMLTGTTPLHHGVHSNVGYRLAASQVTLAELLRQNGFETAAFIGAYVLDSQFGIAQGFDTYDDDLDTVDDNVYHNDRSADRTTALAKAWLADRRDEKFFLFIHYYEPHNPYELHTDHEFPSLPLLSFPEDSYDSEIGYTDHHVGLLIDQLKRLGLYDSTLLIVTGDHGEGHGDHSEDRHGFFIYHSTIHVPLVIKAPGQSVARRVQDAVGLVDILPTICSLTGIEIPDHVQGTDLSAYLEGASPPGEGRYLFSESMQPTEFGAAPLMSLTSDRWKYIHSVRPEFYDLRNDPRETENLIDEAPRDLEPLRDKLLGMLASREEAGATAGVSSVDEETRERLRSLGYIGFIANESVNIQPGQEDAKDWIDAWSARDELSTLVTAGEIDEARKLSLELLEQYPDIRVPFALEALGALAIEEGDYAAAMEYLDRLLALDHAPYKVHISYAAVLTELGEYAAAIGHLKKALDIDPDSHYAYISLADTFAAAGQFRRAAATMRKALELEVVAEDPKLTREIKQRLRAYRPE